MARKLKAEKVKIPYCAHYGWDGGNAEPYEYLLEHLCENKTPEDCKKIEQKVQESFTYLAICEMGAAITLRIVELYEIEQKEGFFGALYFLMEKDPRFRIEYDNYEYIKKQRNGQND